MKRRTTCIHCAAKGIETTLVQTGYGNLCPIHNPDLLAHIYATQPLPKPQLLNRGIPYRAKY